MSEVQLFLWVAFGIPFGIFMIIGIAKLKEAFLKISGDNDTAHFEILKFEEARLVRGEMRCYRAKMFINGKLDGLVWLSRRDIDNIKKDKSCTLGGFEKYERKEKTDTVLDEKNINLAKAMKIIK